MKGFDNILAKRALPWSQRTKIGLLSSLSMSAAIAMGSPAAAQDAAPAALPVEAAESGDITDIVVTARRREESLQSVPVSVTVATPQILKEQRIVQASDLQILAPSLTVTASSVSQGQSGSFNIRGQAQTFGGALPSVITYFSEVPLESQGGAAFALYDIDSVQVLRGPQGTLFGRNTVGGAVLITPTAASRDFSGYVDASFGNLKNRELKGAINLPVTEKLFVRLAGSHVRRDDITKNLAGHDFGNRHSDSWRAFVRWEPSDTFRNDLVYNGLRAREHGDAFILAGLRAGRSASLFNGGSMVPEFLAQRQRGPRVVSNSQEGLGASRKVHLVVNTTTLEIDGGPKIKNIVSYERVKVCYGSDLDGVQTRQSLSSCFPTLVSQAAGINPFPDVNLQQLTEELQMSGTAFDGRLDYQVGGFLSRSRSPGGLNTFRVNRVTFAGANATTLQAALTINQFKDTSKGIYTQNSFHFGADREFTLTGGLRYTWDTRRAAFGRATALFPALGAPPPFSAFVCSLPGIGTSAATPVTQCYRQLKQDFNGLGYTFGADWKINRGTLLYVTTRHGFKDGGFNTVIASGNNPAYSREKATDYELGLKSTYRIGDVSGRFNIAGFTGKYKGLQRQVTGGLPVTSIFVNVPKAIIKGIEIESFLKLGEFSVSTQYAYQTGDYTGFIDGGVNVSASQLLGLPKHSGSVTGRWEHELPGGDGSIIASATLYATTRYPYIANNFSNFEAFVKAYQTLAARLEWRNVLGKNLDVALWGKNLTNETYIIGGAAQGSSSGITSYIYADPRTYGVQATFRF